MVEMTKCEAADLIESFLNNVTGDWDWDDFISVRQSDPELETIRKRSAGLPEEFPPVEKGHYCGPQGIGVLKEFVVSLRLSAGRH